MENDNFKKGLNIIVLASMILLLYPLLYKKSSFLQEHFRTYHFFDRFLLSEPAADTLTAPTVADTLLPDAIPLELPKYDGRENLAPFYQALRRGKQQVRVAHFGDSSIEGDLITGSFRDSLQRRFGGGGVGMVPIVNPISGFRRSIWHSYSDNWYHCYIGKENQQELPRGLSGEYFSTWVPPDTTSVQTDSLSGAPASPEIDTTIAEAPVDEGHWVFYRGVGLFQGTRNFPTARLFYGARLPDSTGYYPQAGTVAVTVGGETFSSPLDGEAPLNELLLSATPASRLRLSFDLPPTLPLYGVSLESQSGIIVDNFPSRGNIGPALLYVSASMLSDYQAALDYDLIMLQFGLNALNPKMTDYSWYEREMVRTIRHFQQAMPGVAILLIGPSDRALKINGRMQSDPSVARVTETLRHAAEKTGVAFFSFYEAMGGENSMVEWVEVRQPSLANKDYTHFNFAGAREAAMLLLEFLLADLEEE